MFGFDKRANLFLILPLILPPKPFVSKNGINTKNIKKHEGNLRFGFPNEYHVEWYSHAHLSTCRYRRV
jgi:hypothetical protein